MPKPLIKIDLFVEKVLSVTVVRHFRDWSSEEVVAIRAGLGSNVHTDARYPRYIVIAGQHELEPILKALGSEPLLLVVTHPTSKDELPFDIK